MRDIGVGGIECLFFLCFGGIGVLGTIFWIWMLIDAAMNEPSDYNDKVIWVIVIALTHVLGALIYFFARRPKRIAEHGK